MGGFASRPAVDLGTWNTTLRHYIDQAHLRPEESQGILRMAELGLAQFRDADATVEVVETLRMLEAVLVKVKEADDVNALRREEFISTQLKTRDPDNLKRKRNTLDDDEDICAVCHGDLTNQEEDVGKIAILDCGHEYHQKCVVTWLVRTQCCPICRADVKIEEETA